MIDRLQKQSSDFLSKNNLISKEQHEQISAYQQLEIFSLHTELRLLIYFSISLFCGGVGLFIANNIDQIGHTVVLSILFLCIAACYYIAFKKAPKFSWSQTNFANMMYEYVVLMAVILSGIFIGYLQFQFSAFGYNYSFATLLPTIVALATAFYFDNKSVLSIGITGLIATIGLSVNARSLLNGDIFDGGFLSISGVLLAVSLLFCGIYSEKLDLKAHFAPVFYNFSMHLMGIVGVANMIESNWVLYLVLLSVFFYNIIKISIVKHSILLFVFSLIYSYLVITIALYQISEALNLWSLLEDFFIIFPIFFGLSIVGFILLIQKFRKRNGSI
ncbi:MAG: DUF2157 domain-containing protein [Flavobacterium sp.]